MLECQPDQQPEHGSPAISGQNEVASQLIEKQDSLQTRGAGSLQDRMAQEEEEVEREGRPLQAEGRRQPQSPDLDRILSRIHNLELLAVRGDERSNSRREPLDHPEGKTLQDTEMRRRDLDILGQGSRSAHSADLQLAVQRIQIIEADFELLHSKYSKGSAAATPVERARLVEEEGRGMMGKVSREMMVDIEQEILAELLSRELWLS